MNNTGDRYCSRNFMNLYFGSIMTVEFSRGPGVEGLEECEAWVNQMVAFVQAARQRKPSQIYSISMRMSPV